MNTPKRIITIKRSNVVQKLGRKMAIKKYSNLMAYYDTPQFYDEVMADCRYILDAINEGYNYIDVDEMIKTY